MASLHERTIHLSHLTLRPLVESDAAAYSTLLRDPSVTIGLPSAPRGCDVGEAVRLIVEAERLRSKSNRLHWALERRDDHCFLGEVSVDVRSGEFGIWLGAAYRRQGFAGSTLAALIPRLTAERGVGALRAAIVRGNEASARLFEKHGFEFAGLRVEGVGARHTVWMDYLRR